MSGSNRRVLIKSTVFTRPVSVNPVHFHFPQKDALSEFVIGEVVNIELT